MVLRGLILRELYWEPEMNPEITKLQILNDLIAQTLDVLTQRNLMAQRAAMFGGGLSHAPYAADPRFGAGLGFAHTPAYGVDPRMTMGYGLNHTPAYGVDPRMTVGYGLNHAPAYGVDPRLTQQGFGLQHTPAYGVDPRVGAPYGVVPQYGIDPRLGVPAYGWSQGLSHTSIDPRFAAHGLGVAHAIQGINWNTQSQNVWPQQPQTWNLAGLQHTPYVDPRLAYDPRMQFGAPVMGIDPRLGYGINGF